MKTEHIVNELIAMIEGYPDVASQLSDLQKDKNELYIHLVEFINNLIKYNCLHTIRLESQNAVAKSDQNNSVNTLLYAYTGLAIFIGLLKRREHHRTESGEFSGDSGEFSFESKDPLPHTELEAVFLELDKILVALSKMPTTVAPSDITFMTASMLCAQAAYMAAIKGSKSQDISYNVKSYCTIYNYGHYGELSTRNWNYWQLHILWALKLINTDPNKSSHVDFFENPTDLEEGVNSGDRAAVQQAIMKGENVNSIGKKFDTPLHRAIFSMRFEIVKLLLNAENIDPNSRNRYGDTPLHVAAFFKLTDFIRELISHPKIDINAVNYQKLTPLSSVIFSHFSLLLQPADLNRKASIEILLNKGAKPSKEDLLFIGFGGATMLHYAITYNNVALIELLLKEGADPTAHNDKLALTPLHIAITRHTQEDNYRSIIEILLKHGKLLHEKKMQSGLTSTPLHEIKNQLGMSATELAKSLNKPDILALHKLYTTAYTLSKKTPLTEIALQPGEEHPLSPRKHS